VPFDNPLGHRNLGPVGLGGGVNLALDGDQITATNISDGESPNSLNWRHYRTNLVPRDELSALVTLNPVATGVINGLNVAEFENRTRQIIIHDKAHVWAYDGTTMTDLRDVSGVITSGNDNSPWSGAMVAGHGTAAVNAVYAFCNGSNELCYWTGDIATDALTMISRAGYAGPASLVGRYVAGWAGRCFLGHVQEGANAFASRLRWSSDANLTNWNSATGAGAGAVDLLDAPGEITGMIAQSEETLTVFKTGATVLAQETGDARSPIAFPTYLPIGSLMGHTARHIGGGAIIFPGTDGFYMLNGQNYEAINPKVWLEFSRLLNYSRTQQAIAWTRPDLGLYFITIPIAGQVDANGKAQDATRCYVYNWREDKWDIDVYPAEIHSAVTSNLGPTVTWGTASGTWGAGSTGTLPWSSYISTGAPPVVVVGTLFTTGDWRLYKFITSVTGSDLGTFNIPYSYTTKDYRFSARGRSTIYGVFIDFYSTTGTGQISVQTVTDRATTGSSVSKTVPVPGNNRLFFPLRSTGLFHRLIITADKPLHIFTVEPVVAERDAAEN
jgi:hypothetical protein